MSSGTKIIYWEEKVETLPREELLALQWKRLKNFLRYILERSPLYRRKLSAFQEDVDSIRDMDAFKKLLSMTTKDEIRAERERTRDPYGGLLCVPPEEIVHLCRTGGTTGVPSIYGLTRRDVEMLGEFTARCWYQIGAKREHTVACATMGGWNNFAKALMEGLRVAGINVYHFSMPVPGEEVFPIEVLSQWMDIHGFYLSPRPLLQITEKYGERLKSLLPKLQYVLVAGQRMTRSFRVGIESLWGGCIHEAYPMTDVGLPTATCSAQRETFHIPEDAFLVEVVDPDTGKDLTGTGRVGELVVTPLLTEGTPLLRFRTEDIGFTVTGTCPCGRTGMRIGLSERAAHSVSVGKRVIFTYDVEEVLYGFREFLFLPYQLIRRREQPQEKLFLRVQRPSTPASESQLKERLTTRLREAIGVEAEVEFMSKEEEKSAIGYKLLKVVTES
jgi:phenylacetate-CoA ligase